VKKNSLHHEIKEIAKELDKEFVQALLAVKGLGNIGAHPENDTALVVDVEPADAEALLRVIELFIDMTYVRRHNEKQTLAHIQAVNAEKQELRNRDPNADHEDA
jgi:hypothetical protein